MQTAQYKAAYRAYRKAGDKYAAVWDRDHAARVVGQHWGDHNAHVQAYLAQTLVPLGRAFTAARRALSAQQ